MAILKVARIGHPVVRAATRPVPPRELAGAELQRLIDDMIETMHEYDGVGLAAPQVHVGIRLAVIEVPPDDEQGRQAVPLMVLVNPKVQVLDQEMVDGWEGCLSIPELRGVVPRARRLRLEATDRHGTAYALEASDFFARVIQHECDHLEGSVYIDRMAGLKTLSFIREFERFGQEPAG
jgi:peptide deformylase